MSVKSFMNNTPNLDSLGTVVIGLLFVLCFTGLIIYHLYIQSCQVVRINRISYDLKAKVRPYEFP